MEMTSELEARWSTQVKHFDDRHGWSSSRSTNLKFGLDSVWSRHGWSSGYPFDRWSDNYPDTYPSKGACERIHKILWKISHDACESFHVKDFTSDREKFHMTLWMFSQDAYPPPYLSGLMSDHPLSVIAGIIYCRDRAGSNFVGRVEDHLCRIDWESSS